MYTCIRQRGSNSRGEKVGSSRELVSRCVWSSKNNQVPLGCPPAGRHPNAGEGRDRCESVIADFPLGPSFCPLSPQPVSPMIMTWTQTLTVALQLPQRSP